MQIFLQTEQLFHGDLQRQGQAVGQQEGGAVLPLLQGNDAPAGDVDPVGQLLLGQALGLAGLAEIGVQSDPSFPKMKNTSREIFFT